MLQRTRAEQVLPVYLHFTEKYQTPKDVLMEKSEYLHSLLGKLGLKWRAKKIIELSMTLSKQKIPTLLEDLIKLPGVGQYSASAFLCFHRNIRTGIIDANAIRLWSRFFGIKSDDSLRRKKGFIEFIDELTPEDNFRLFNFAVLDFTRIICRKNPVCNNCPLNLLCDYYISIN
jgi:A/G-specific adenine glycosylase